MANYATLKAAITAAIKQNGNNEITGNLLQQQLLAMVNSLGVGYQYIGTATPGTNPGTPDQNVFYIASTAGTYANFNGLVLADGEIAILKYNGAWSKDSTGAASLDLLKFPGIEPGTINADGTDYTGSAPNHYRTPYVPIEDFIEVENTGNIDFVVLDGGKNAMHNSGWISTAKITKNDLSTITGIASAEYIRITWRGQTRLPILGKRTYNLDQSAKKLAYGYLIAWSSGKPVASVIYCYYPQYIPVDGLKFIAVSNDYGMTISQYNSSKEVIAEDLGFYGSVFDVSMITNPNVAYVRISIRPKSRNIDETIDTFEKIGVVVSTNPDKNEFVKLADGLKLIEYENGSINADGTDATVAGHIRTPYILFENLFIIQNTGDITFVLCDENKGAIYSSGWITDEKITKADLSLIPGYSRARYFRCAWRNQKQLPVLGVGFKSQSLDERSFVYGKLISWATGVISNVNGAYCPAYIDRKVIRYINFDSLTYKAIFCCYDETKAPVGYDFGLKYHYVDLDVLPDSVRYVRVSIMRIDNTAVSYENDKNFGFEAFARVNKQFKWEIGKYINGSKGYISANSQFAFYDKFFDIKKIKTIRISNGYNLNFNGYDENYNFIINVGGWTGNNVFSTSVIKNPNIRYVRFNVRRLDGSDIQSNEQIGEFEVCENVKYLSQRVIVSDPENEILAHGAYGVRSTNDLYRYIAYYSGETANIEFIYQTDINVKLCKQSIDNPYNKHILVVLDKGETVGSFTQSMVFSPYDPCLFLKDENAIRVFMVVTPTGGNWLSPQMGYRDVNRSTFEKTNTFGLCKLNYTAGGESYNVEMSVGQLNIMADRMRGSASGTHNVGNYPVFNGVKKIGDYLYTILTFISSAGSTTFPPCILRSDDNGEEWEFLGTLSQEYDTRRFWEAGWDVLNDVVYIAMRDCDNAFIPCFTFDLSTNSFSQETILTKNGNRIVGVDDSRAALIIYNGLVYIGQNISPRLATPIGLLPRSRVKVVKTTLGFNVINDAEMCNVDGVSYFLFLNENGNFHLLYTEDFRHNISYQKGDIAISDITEFMQNL